MDQAQAAVSRHAAAGAQAAIDVAHLQSRLDKLFPRARNKEIVTFEGRRYQLLIIPMPSAQQDSNYTYWNRQWELI